MDSARIDQLLSTIRGLAPAERRELIERASRELAASEQQHPDPLEFIGMFADEPELVQAICEGAMMARERDPLRLPSG